MTEFRNHSDELVIPDDLTVAQFMLDGNHPLRPVRPASAPWLIDDDTGRGVGLEEIRTRVFGLANSLSADYNIRDNDVVCIFSPNHVDFPVAVWAAHRLGAIASCANPGYNAEELVHQLTVSKSSAIIVHPAAIGVAVSAAREAKIPTNRIVLFDADVTSTQKGGFATVSELVHRGLSRPARFVEQRLQKGEAKTKLAFLSFSSGTTGKPKAVGISHYGPIANVLQTAIHWGVGVNPKSDCFAPGDVALCVLPLYHIYGLIVNLHCMLFNAMPVVIVPKFNFSKWLDSIQKFRVSHLLVVPPQVVLLCKSPDTSKADLSSIKYIMSGAAPLTSELQQELTRILPQARIGQGYGMTETATSIALLPWYVKQGAFGCAGRLLPGVTARVVKEDGSLAKVNERGELVVKAPSLALRYTNDAKATAETFVDGWVRTGDEVRIDENNDLYVVDRLKEIIKVRGYQVPPAELEGHLLGHPDVGDVCVVGVPDDYSGEVPMAFVVLSPTAAGRANGNPSEAAKIKASISKYVADHKVRYKHLAGGVEIVESIPKNPSGKLLRRLIRDQARALRAKNAPNKAKL